MSNQQLKQNTKTTHLRNLTKNETPLSLTITELLKVQPQMINHVDDDRRSLQHTHPNSCTTAAANFI